MQHTVLICSSLLNVPNTILISCNKNNPCQQVCLTGLHPNVLRDGYSTALCVKCLMYTHQDNNPGMPEGMIATGCSLNPIDIL